MSLKLLLVNPFLSGDFSALNLSLTAIGSYVNARTPHRASICDLVFHRREWREHLALQIQAKRPDIVGISCDALYMGHIRAVVEEVRLRHGLPVVLGGHHTSTTPDEVISIPGVDAIFLGDSERTLAEYLDRRSAGASMEGLTGVWTREPDGTVTKRGSGQFEPDLDSLPSLDHDLWEDLDLYFRFLGSLYAIGSRGCPYRCTFCDAPGLDDAVPGKYFRLINPRRYVEDLANDYQRYQHRGLKLFMLYDSVFTVDTEWLRQFTDAYREHGLDRKIGYSVFARADNLDEERIRMLASSGCKMVRLGLETGDEKIRAEVYNKRISNAHIYDVVQQAHAAGLNLTTYFIFGGPGETRKSFDRTLRMAWELDTARTPFYIYRPFTTKGREQLDQLGGKIDERRWNTADDISFGAATSGSDWGPRTVEVYQVLAYAITLARRFVRELRIRKHRYFLDMAKYLYHGMRVGLRPRYLIPYFHVFADDVPAR